MARIKLGAVLTAALTATLLVGSLIAAPVARADYHSLCTQAGDGFDALYLERAGAELRYRGFVSCTGQAITISSLSVTPAGGTTTSTGPVTCADACDLSGTIPAAPGVFKLQMTFTVGAATPAPRSAEFLYVGSGNPSRLCPSGLTLNQCV